MSVVLKRNIDFLKLLLKYQDQAKDFLKIANTEQVKAICEIAVNVLYGNIPLDATAKRKLVNIQKCIKVISRKENSEEFCKRILLRNH
jgi:hypothetical protein